MYTHTHACIITNPRTSSCAPTPTPLPRHRVTGTLAADQVLPDTNQQSGIDGQDILCFFDLHGLPHHFWHIICRLRHRTPNVCAATRRMLFASSNSIPPYLRTTESTSSRPWQSTVFAITANLAEATPGVHPRHQCLPKIEVG